MDKGALGKAEMLCNLAEEPSASCRAWDRHSVNIPRFGWSKAKKLYFYFLPVFSTTVNPALERYM